MNILYIAHARIPTEKAHGITIVKSCESFARAGATVELLLPRRRTPFKGDLFETYAVENIFTVRYLRGLDMLGTFSGRFAFFVQSFFFYVRAVLYTLNHSRADWTVYTRDFVLIPPLNLLGYRVVFECHALSRSRKLFFASCRKAHRIVVISEALKSAFIAEGFESADILVAPSGVDTNTFDITTTKHDARVAVGLPLDAKIAVYLGNFTTMGEDKGLSTILHALTHIHDVHFVAVGGSEKDRLHYGREAQDLGVLSQVTLVGYTPQKTFAIYQKAADVLLMPFPDTPHYRHHMSPVKMFEYMMSKTPIIASNLPTITEVLNDANASLVPPGDPQVLATAIRDVLFDREKNARRAIQAHTDVAKYAWESRAQRVIEFIEN